MTKRPRLPAFRFMIRSVCVAVILLTSIVSLAQTESATMSGTVMDRSGAVVADTKIEVTNSDTNVKAATTTNKSGIYVVTGLRPGRYRMAVSKDGFRSIVVTDITLNVQDTVSRNFNLDVGAFSESITVTADQININTTDGTVSTVVDRQFAENLPLNGRSFQTLIQLTPGVVLTTNNGTDTGQFSINGQRATSNYWMVDGVSANLGVSTTFPPGNGVGGTLGSYSVLGGTNSLVSVDAMQEFRIQTSTYAPEFGRTPGGQISIVTRSGTNQFHGTAFDYLRNDALDANNWFNGFTNNPALPKAQERQNDFGGTFAGPIIKDRAFFFFSYEGLRLRLPQTALTTVPDVAARQGAIPALQPYLNAFPFDPKQPDLGNGIAQFNASYSNPASLDAYSLRIDHKLSDKVMLFGRYNYSPSELRQRANTTSLSTLFSSRITTQTGTVGATWAVSPTLANDIRFNYSRTNSLSGSTLDNFGGAVPLASLPLPSPFTAQNASFLFDVFALGRNGSLFVGANVRNVQRQINIVDSVSMQRGSHSLKFGVDFRRLSPVFDPGAYFQDASFLDMPSAEAGNLFFSITESARGTTLLFHNLGTFAQDTWRVLPRLALTYGVRWDIDFAPSSINGPALNAVTGFNLSDLTNLALAPPGTPPYKTTYGNVAPRIGLAYQLNQNQSWQTVFRGGFGVFYDLASSEAGNALNGSYPFGALGFNFGGSFPLTPSAAAPPPITASNLASQGTLYAFNPLLELPYALQWNAALEQGLGVQQTVTISYVGASGRRLLQTAIIPSPNASFANADLVSNTATSDYHALQIQFQRRLTHGLQVLASYAWSHSIDDGSAGSYGNAANFAVPGLNANENRGPSDFDVRNAFSIGLTYDLPTPKSNEYLRAVVGKWSTENVIQAHSAVPVNVYYSQFNELLHASTLIRPDLTGAPLYLFGAQCGQFYALPAGVSCPGGKGFNPNAFMSPPLDPQTQLPTRQGNLGRNGLRGFGLAQWDFAIHRDFPIRESLKLQFRAEMFNVLNHPNFGPPVGDLGSPAARNPQFGLSNQLLGQSLSGGTGQGAGAFSPLYQVGAPRSIQFALKLAF